MSMNCGDGRVSESTRRFHDASPASQRPALRPTRGSGLGALVDMSPTGAGPPPPEDAVDGAHAAADSNPSASSSDSGGVTVDRRVWCGNAMAVSSDGAAWDGRTGDGAVSPGS